MRSDLADKYDLRVPRYTSYPTAPHFHDGIDGETYRGWLETLDDAIDLSLYFHIPFCDSMCWFCGCYTKIVNRYEPIHDYLEVLLAEVDLVADTLPKRFDARHAHWGGGSPTMLTGEDWRRIIDRLRDRFELGNEAEIAVELDPRDTTRDYVAALAAAGVNRTSIGVQDFHAEVQEAINRIQPFDVTERVVGWLRDHGIEKLNMDLMYGLPHQTEERVVHMVDLAVRLRPDRVALFGYAHVPWMKTHQKMIDEDALPGAAERWTQFEAASARLVSHGYVAIGLDHFSRPGDDLALALEEDRLHRNFQGYTTDTAPALIGFGASAIGSLPRGYVQNTSPLKQYREAVGAGRFPIGRGFELAAEDRARGSVIERLMCDLTVDLDAVAGTAFRFDKEMERLSPLADDGIVTIDGSRISITNDGRPFVRLVAAVFDSYLNVGEKRHSRAV